MDGIICIVDLYDICVDGRCEVWVIEFSCYVIYWSEYVIFKFIYFSGVCVLKWVCEENFLYEMDFDLFENEFLVGICVYLNGIG